MKHFLKPTKGKIYLAIAVFIIYSVISLIHGVFDIDLCPLRLPISINGELISQHSNKNLPFIAPYSHNFIDEWNRRYTCDPVPDSQLQMIFKNIKPYVLFVFSILVSYVLSCAIVASYAKLKNNKGNKKR